MFRKSKCYNGGNRHKFQPRYDEKLPDGSLEVSGCGSVRSLFEKFYICDVCEWCGKVVNKKEK